MTPVSGKPAGFPPHALTETRSSMPSPFTSPTEITDARAGTLMFFGASNHHLPEPEKILTKFKHPLSLHDPMIEVTMSGLPSWLKSAVVTLPSLSHAPEK